MKKHLTRSGSFLLGMACMLCGTKSIAQLGFTNSNTQLTTAAFHSGNVVAVTDMNSDGLDDMLRMNSGTTISLDLQNRTGGFTSYAIGTSGMGSAWGMAVADLDHNGWKDVIIGGGSSGKLCMISHNGTSPVGTITTLPNSNFFWQNITIVDLNNDGWEDVYGCDDNAYSKVYMNNGSGGLEFLAHSVNNLTIGTGPATLSVQGGLSFSVGQTVKIGFDADNYMSGTVTAYNSSNGQLSVDVTSTVGSGSFPTWSVHPTIVFNQQTFTQLYGSDPANSGNYGSVWTDFDHDGDVDLFIAKCRQASSSPTDLRRINQVFVNDGNNNYKEDAAAYGLNIGWQTWTASFGDIDNDGDFDQFITNHDYQCQIFQNDGAGNFTDITSSTMLNYSSGSIMQSILEDFDNDGFVDILISGSEWKYFKNNGNGTFSAVTGLFANNGMNSYGVGDLNHDGFVDVYALYGDVYVNPTSFDDILYLNNRNGNHYITFDLTGTVSTQGAVGAKAYIYGPWGVQVRELRQGESYGNNYSAQLHFGLGTITQVDSARIEWPSGIVTHLGQLNADQFVKVVENQCTITGNILSGAPVICPGQSATLSAAPGFTSYLWSTGETTPTISVSATGSYNVQVSQGNGCSSISPTVVVTQNPDETPTINAPADLVFCEGGAISLTSSSASGGYLWSTGDTAQSIAVTAPGAYTVTIQGTCQQYTSDSIVVSMLPSPAPSATGTSITSPQSVTLTATGNNLTWYDVPSGGVSLGSGSSFTTPVINAPTTYYVEDVASFPGAIGYTGKTNHTGTSLYSGGTTTNANEIFDVLASCVLKSVKVYTDSAGTRTILLRQGSATGPILDSVVVFIPADTNRITLNLNLVPGVNYYLGTSAWRNQQEFGFNGPRLRRNSTGVNYPYMINNLISINNSDQGLAYYYYFYDWEVQEADRECVSSRTPVTVDFILGNLENSKNDFTAYPNPFNDEISVRLNSVNQTGPVVMDVLDVAGRVVLNQSARMNQESLQVINAANLAPGLYSLRVRNSSGEWIQRLIKK